MKVKIGSRIYDAEEQPIMIICTHEERQQMASMPEENTKYCQFPDLPEWTDDDNKAIKNWMRIDFGRK